MTLINCSVKNSLKISGGPGNGLALRSPPADIVRPTPVRVRKSVFDILGRDISEGPFLDLFSGSGVMAIEAVLRGAPGAVCVETNKDALKTIRGNIHLTRTDQQIRVVPGDVLKSLTGILTGTSFRWIFMDPPYASDMILKVLNALSGMELNDPCTVITEAFHKSTLPEIVSCMKRFRSEKYGDTVIQFWNQTCDEFHEETPI